MQSYNKLHERVINIQQRTFNSFTTNGHNVTKDENTKQIQILTKISERIYLKTDIYVYNVYIYIYAPITFVCEGESKHINY